MWPCTSTWVRRSGTPSTPSNASWPGTTAARTGASSNTLGVGRLREVHPRLDDFLAVRDRLDPKRVLANPHLERILGP